MYAISDSGYRAVTAEMQLNAGETRVTELPAALLTRIKGDQMKAERNQRLRSTDWTQMDDAPLTALVKAAYQAYRQALRDLPQADGFPDCPWPSPPAGLDGSASVTLPAADPT
ncbi:phage tail assembly chaperone [Stenotrophomonas maltophilia]|nr:phage tail assembly chaperone [Stenotrophomonas maltophilia]